MRSQRAHPLVETVPALFRQRVPLAGRTAVLKLPVRLQHPLLLHIPQHPVDAGGIRRLFAEKACFRKALDHKISVQWSGGQYRQNYRLHEPGKVRSRAGTVV